MKRLKTMLLLIIVFTIVVLMGFISVIHQRNSYVMWSGGFTDLDKPASWYIKLALVVSLLAFVLFLVINGFRRKKADRGDGTIRDIVNEYLRGEGVLFLDGAYSLDQGFSIFSVSNNVLHLHLKSSGKAIKRVITLREFIDLKDSPYCTNKESAEDFLTALGQRRIKRLLKQAAVTA